MKVVAAHLVDHVLPPVPVRQWVLSLPWHLRFALAGDPELLRKVASAFIRSVSASYRRRVQQELEDQIASPAGSPLTSSTHRFELTPGAVNFVQRFGSNLGLNIHFHALCLPRLRESSRQVSLIPDGSPSKAPRPLLRPLDPPHARYATPPFAGSSDAVALLKSYPPLNNGTVLIDKIHRLRSEEGLARSEAVVEGAAARVRPIVITALTTVVGLLPIVLDDAPAQGIDYRALATCIAGGLAICTFFTLWVVPLTYTLLDDFGAWVVRLVGRAWGRAGGRAAAPVDAAPAGSAAGAIMAPSQGEGSR